MHSEEESSKTDALDLIVTEYIERLNAGGRIEPDEVLLKHPGQGEEILAQLGLFARIGSNRSGLDSKSLGTLGDYTLRGQIGRGGMGVVYKAWQNSVERLVALKVLPPGYAADERSLQRFVREAKTAAQLDHPNVVGVYGMGLEKETPYFAMELVEGETLAQVLAKLRGTEAGRETSFGNTGDIRYFHNVAEAFSDVADGLQHAHAKGITHRDIKPSNLILDVDGRLRILDFGLARLVGQESLTVSGDFVGTPLYMSPEQARRKKIPLDHRTDIYSLGATMYEAICGRPPFRGKDHADTLSQIVDHDPTQPRKVNKRVPKDLETIVLKCLRKRTEDRYGTAEALGQDLRRFVRGDPIEAQPLSSWERVARRAWRFRWMIGASAAGLFVLTVLSVIGLGVIWGERERTRFERDIARRNYYFAEMHLAQQAWENDEPGRLDAILERQMPGAGELDWRGWEWYFLKTATRLPRVLRGHKADVVDIAWSADGTRLVSAGQDKSVRIWRLEDPLGKPMVLSGHDDIVTDVDWSPSDSQVVSASRDGRVMLWRTDDGQRVVTFEGHVQSPDEYSGVQGAAWSPDGNEIATASSDKTVRVFSTSTGKERLALEHESWVLSVAWNNDGTRLASTAFGGAVTLWNAKTGARIRRFGEGRAMSSTDVVWSPDGHMLAATNQDGIGLWDPTRGERVLQLEIEGQVGAMSFSPAANRLLTATWEEGWVIWDLETGQPIDSIRGHAGNIHAVSWSPDGQRFATGGSDRTIKIWPLEFEPPYRDLQGYEDKQSASDVARSSDGRRLAVISPQGGTRVWDLESDDVILRIEQKGHEIAWSPDQNRLATASGEPVVKIWDAQSGAEVCTLEGHEKVVNDLSWSPDGSRLATAGRDRTVRIWDVASGESQQVLRGHGRAVFGIDWHPSKPLLATGGYDRTLIFWDLASGKIVRRITGHWPNELRWSPDGKRLATVSYDGRLRIFRTHDQGLEYELEGHYHAILDLAWSPDGTRLATGGGEARVRIWDTSSGQEVMAISTSGDPIKSLDWATRGNGLTVGLMSGRVRIFTASPALKREERRW